MSEPELEAAAGAIALGAAVVERAAARLAELARDGDKVTVAKLDAHQVLAYDLAHGAAAVEGSRVMLEYGARGDVDTIIACAYIADAIWDLGTRVLGRADAWGRGLDALAPALP